MTNFKNRLSEIKHIVVLMLENRSFDNMLGWLYDPDNAPPFKQVPRGQQFEGVSGKKLTNPVPAAFGDGVAKVGKGTDMQGPHPNPNEAYADVYGQLFGHNPPPAFIPNETSPPSMQGFVNNYAEAIKAYNKHHLLHKSHTGPGSIMNCFTPDMVPVISTLANAYAVCDHWFSSAPTETFPNRSFVHAGTSSGHVYNNWKTGILPWDIGLFINHTPTIFNLLEEAGQSWKIYHGGSLLTCFAYLLQSQIQHFATTDPETNRFFSMDQFWHDAAAPATGPDSLPSYSFIEPRYFSSLKHGPENDAHPAYLPIDIDGPSNVLQAEILIRDVYQALRNSPNWEHTLLIITFDEHGGCYDHVPPPAAVSPDGIVIPPPHAGGRAEGSGFEFNRLGVRVPAILVSPWIEAGTVCNTVFDHTSIIKTIIECFGLKDAHGNQATLLAREAAANSVGDVLTLAAPRTDTPVITARPAPVESEPAERLLMGIHKDLLLLAAHHLGKLGRTLIDLSQIQTREQAAALLDEHSKLLANAAKMK